MATFVRPFHQDPAFHCARNDHPPPRCSSKEQLALSHDSRPSLSSHLSSNITDDRSASPRSISEELRAARNASYPISRSSQSPPSPRQRRPPLDTATVSSVGHDPLSGVPLQYVISRLRYLAPTFWTRPHTANCIIYLPVDLIRPSDGGPEGLPRSPTGSLIGRKSPDASAPSVPLRQVRLHTDYLIPQSALFKTLLDPVSCRQLLASPSGETRTSFSPQYTSFRFPSHMTPRLIVSTPNGAPKTPSIYLPVPDPSSLSLLIHYLYFGKFDHIRESLESSKVGWEGLVRNVEYLGLGPEMKMFLGRWKKDNEGRQEEVVIMEQGELDSGSDEEPSDFDLDHDGDDGEEYDGVIF